jgi:tRNA pseudouridine55 synthase
LSGGRTTTHRATLNPAPPTTTADKVAREGLLLVDKPAGFTSHDVVARARRALGVKRIGHAGTLDPFATGLLVLLVGRATRLATWLDGEPKVYDATIRFGTETSTDDRTGEPTGSAPLPEPSAVRSAMAQLTGEISQVPPAVSAKQVGGVRAYAAARKGKPLELRAVRVVVHEWNVRDLRADTLEATIVCTGGTYVRALARDLGRLAGSAAHLDELRRVRSGPFDVTSATPLESLSADTPLQSPLDGMRDVVVQSIADEDARRVRHGLAVAASVPGARAALVDASGALVAVAARDGDRWQPRVVLGDD